jgi:Kef-type K+ transport system membrane component KefB
VENIKAYELLLAICSVVMLSYLFSIISRITRIPSVLMLIGAGICMTHVAGWYGIQVRIPHLAIEILGTIGLIMIVLEAALELDVSREKLPLLRASFSSALTILVISIIGISYIFHTWLPFTWQQSLIYAIPFATVSSAIVLPSVGHLKPHKREFLIYEAAFSDIVGIMFFNAVAASAVLTIGTVLGFVGSLLASFLISFVVCALLMFLLLHHGTQVRFFLAFAVLILVYVLGKMLNLPSLITILIFGVVVNNWKLFEFDLVQERFPIVEVKKMADFLKSITAESSFLVRTFFFIVFGMSINLDCFADQDAMRFAGMVLLVLIATRFVYLRVLNHENLFPEVLYAPRGLISVLLFYKIPAHLVSSSFKIGILVVVIVVSNLVMMVGALVYKK